ncbi:PucR family transcriptional regulator [[Mycobacterium] crassicus]|uniref:Helix-turn-helix domain-containing protein n=1 Tax=[Mycobacterium] crassicus TaxID=2872309 RepID=A0ABU5XE65_9MYCO|nr:helix-turn-helix domain-containing protein [Mycolicibacter sp. MYC098]MEB3019607.1 helix-turn-helix domain-containing protein [Mycolicibacter sp. MYC098]
MTNKDPAPDRGVAVVTALLGSRMTEVTRSVYDTLAAEVAELRDDPHLLDLMYSSVESNVETIFDALQHDIPLERIQPPTAALEYARRLAQRGVPVPALIRAYRLGQQALLNLVLAEIRRSGLDPGVNLEVFGQMTTTVSSYIDWISQQVLATYEAERERWLENRSHIRGERMRAILDGEETNIDRASAGLGYPLRATHLALVVWLREQDGSPTRLADLEQAVRAVAESFGGQAGPLFVAVDRVSGWAWIPLRDAIPGGPAVTAGIERALADRPARLCIAAGIPLPGLDGFRRSHRQALQAHAVATAAGRSARRVTTAGTPGLRTAALLSQDLEQARGWVLDVLGPLATNTDTDARLRATVRTFLRHGSYKTAADELNLHFNTVKYRLRRADERRGRPITTDRLDVELALLVCDWFGSTVLRPPNR